MSVNKKTDTTTTTEGSAPQSIPLTGTIASMWLATKAKINKDPAAGNIVKKANGQKLVAAPSGFKYIFEDEMLQHLMLLNG